MKALDRKLLRGLWHMRGQVLAIAAVIMGGLADAFASLKRAPEPIAERLAALPGVERLDTRVKAGVKLEVAGFSDPITGQILSLPDVGPGVGVAQLNRLY